jgi:hypothetical protein
MYTAYSKQEIRKKILDVLAVRAIESKPSASMRQIARAIGKHPNGNMSNVLWSMVDDGLLVANPRPWRPNKTAWDWQIPAHKLEQLIGQVYEVQK